MVNADCADFADYAVERRHGNNAVTLRAKPNGHQVSECCFVLTWQQILGLAAVAKDNNQRW
jgi:hypothetical protein